MNRLLRITIRLLPGLLVLFCQTGWGEPVYQFDLHFTTNVPSSVSWLTGHYRSSTDSVPSMVVSSKAIIFTNRVPTALPIIADESLGTGTGYSWLWIDLNGDGKYTSNECIQLTGNPKYPSTTEFKCLVNDANHNHWVSFHGYLNLLHKQPILRLLTRLGYEGSVNIGGKTVRVSLRDSNGNGRIAEFLSDDNGEAEMYISSDSDTNHYDTAPLARMMGLFGHFYAVDLSIHGDMENPDATLSLAQTELETGVVELTGDGITSVVLTDNGKSLILHPQGHCIIVPAGSWQPDYMIVNEGGQDFMADFLNGSPHVKFDPVRAGVTNTIHFGGPLKHKVTVDGGMWSGRAVARFSSSVGIGGESYEIIRPDLRSVAAGWIIRRPGGTSVITSGDFRFG